MPSQKPDKSKKIEWTFGAMALSNPTLTLEQKASAWDKSTHELTAAELEYVSGETRPQQLRKAEILELEHGQPDRSKIVHTFPNGWSIREHQTLGDLRREGELMQNCFRPQCHDARTETINEEYRPYLNQEDYEPYRDAFGKAQYRANLGAIPWYEPIFEKGRYFSLRDPDNLPHVSIDHGMQYGAVLGKRNIEPNPEHRAMVDDWETKEFGEPIEGFDPSNPTWRPDNERTASTKNELHIGLSLPKQAATELNIWVHDQEWPDGTELLEPDEYHVTLLFCQGGTAKNHHDDKWTHKRHAISITGIREFPPSEERDGLHPIILLVKGDGLKSHHDELATEAEHKGLNVGQYAHGKYKPHITIAYGPGLPDNLKPPSLTFETEISKVSTPREDSETESSREYKERHKDDHVEAATEKPPNLKEAKGHKSCKTCWAFNKGKCEMFGGYKVKAYEVCDDWEETKGEKKESKTSKLHLTEGTLGRENDPNRAVLVWPELGKVIRAAPGGQLRDLEKEFGDLGLGNPRDQLLATQTPTGVEWYGSTLAGGGAYDRPFSTEFHPMAEEVERALGAPPRPDWRASDPVPKITDRACPACKGNGYKPGGFYHSDAGECPYCQGAGIRRGELPSEYYEHSNWLEDDIRTHEEPGEKSWIRHDPYPPEWFSTKIGGTYYDEIVKLAKGDDKLWLDDTRRPPDDTWTWARNVAEAIELLKGDAHFDEMSLDHDLSMEEVDGKAVVNPSALSGGDFVAWLHEHGDKKHMPKKVILHTHNIHAIEPMLRLLEDHTKVRIEPAPDDLEEDWAREFKVHEPSEIKKEVVDLPEKVGTDSWKSRDKWPNPESDLGELMVMQHRRTDPPQAPPVGKGQTEDEDEDRHLTVKPTEDESLDNAAVLPRSWRQAKETLPQQKVMWEAIKPHPRSSQSQVVHEFPNGWTVQHHPSKQDMWAVGEMMRNCWRSQSPKPGRLPMALHDEYGIPRAAFYLAPADPINKPQDTPSKIVAPWRERNKRITPEQEAYLNDFARTHGYIMGQVPEGVEEGEPEEPTGGTLSASVKGEMWKHATEHGNSDSRRYQDDHMLVSPAGPAPNATEGGGSEPKGCTCKHDHKLDCPIHGMHPTQPDPGLEWSIAEGSPVGWHQENYTKGGHEAALWQLPQEAVKNLWSFLHPEDEDLEAIRAERAKLHAEPNPTWGPADPLDTPAIVYPNEARG